MKPEVSVIIPFYTPGHRLKEAIESIQAQTLTNFELLLINNCADEGSLHYARQKVRRDRRIRILEESRRGVAYAANTGIRHARTTFICRMDADDVAMPRRLQLQTNYLKTHPRLDAVSGLAQYKGRDMFSPGFQHYVEWQNNLLTEEAMALNRFVELPFPNPATCWRASMTRSSELFREGDFPEDYEFWLRMYEQGARIGKVLHSVIAWYDSLNRLTRSDARYSDESFHRIKARYLALWLSRNNPFHPNIVVWGGGKNARKYAKFLTEYGIRIRYFVDIRKRTISGYSCIHYTQLPKPGQIFVTAYVRKRGARSQIRKYLNQLGYDEGVNYIAAA